MKTALTLIGFLWGLSAVAQSLTSTTLVTAITSNQSQLELASTTGMSDGDMLFIDAEALRVKSVDGGTVVVERGPYTAVKPHAAGAPVVWGRQEQFTHTAPSGACDVALDTSELLDIGTGARWNCAAGAWTQTFAFSGIVAAKTANFSTDLVAAGNVFGSSGVSVRQNSADHSPIGWEMVPFEGISQVGAFRTQLGTALFNGTWDHIWRIGYNVAMAGSGASAPAAEHTFMWNIEHNFNDGARNLIESYFETTNPFTGTTQRPWTVNVNRATNVIQHQFSFGADDGVIVFQESPAMLEVFGIRPGYVRFGGNDRARMSVDDNGYLYHGVNIKHSAATLRAIQTGPVSALSTNGNSGLMYYAAASVPAGGIPPTPWRVDLSGNSIQAGFAAADSFRFDYSHPFAMFNHNSGGTVMGSMVSAESTFSESTPASGVVFQGGHIYFRAGQSGTAGNYVPERLYIDGNDGSVTLRGYQQPGLLATDANGKIVRIPGAVTASGTSCTITAITQGAITGATCAR